MKYIENINKNALANIGDQIVTQAKQFEGFLDIISEIEINGITLTDDIFTEAIASMPLFQTKIENLRNNLLTLNNDDLPLPRLDVTGEYVRRSA